MVVLKETVEIKGCGILKEPHHIDVIAQRWSCNLIPLSEICHVRGSLA